MVQAIDEARRAGPAASGSRIPPHNLHAEESLLGAMLLSRDAIAAAIETCVADDFYKPAHGHIFDAITTLYTTGSRPTRSPSPTSCAGPACSRPSAAVGSGHAAGQHAGHANAARYARIVEEHALLRRLIGVAGEIAELGYGLPEDVAEASTGPRPWSSRWPSAG